MRKGTIYQKDIKIPNVCTLNNRALSYSKQNLKEINKNFSSYHIPNNSIFLQPS